MVRKILNKRMHAVAGRLIYEISFMAMLQQGKIVHQLAHAPSRLVEAKVAELIRKRRAKRKARLQQKASRKANRS